MAADNGWVDLFNKRNLDGWRPSENQGSWKAVNGDLVADGPRSHLFYTGPVRGASFRNFELEVEALARPGCNSGVFFHTAYQETGFPLKGFEVKLTGSLYGRHTLPGVRARVIHVAHVELFAQRGRGDGERMAVQIVDDGRPKGERDHAPSEGRRRVQFPIVVHDW
jgi:hypothetical protein